MTASAHRKRPISIPVKAFLSVLPALSFNGSSLDQMNSSKTRKDASACARPKLSTIPRRVRDDETSGKYVVRLLIERRDSRPPWLAGDTCAHSLAQGDLANVERPLLARLAIQKDARIDLLDPVPTTESKRSV